VVHKFGPFEYDSEQRVLSRNGEPVPLIPKATDLLHVLIERRGRIAGKQELISLVWPDTTVEEIGLARNISILRKALGDDAEDSRYIETVPTRGYRFRAAAAEDAPASSPVMKPRTLSRSRLIIAAAAAVLAAFIYWQFYAPSRYLPPARASIVLVPFEVLGAQVEPSVPLALNEALVVEISRIPAIHVVSPSTTRRYQRIGFPVNLMARLLGAQVMLEGSVRHAAGNIHASARLSDVHSGKVIWAESFQYDAAKPDGAPQAAALIASQLRRRLAN